MLKPFDFSILTERIRRIVKKERNIKVIQKERTITDENLEKEITNIMHDIGVPAHIRGHQFLREAIMLVMKDNDILNGITLLSLNLLTAYSNVSSAVYFVFSSFVLSSK
jgi:two-component system response regulator (stage 0 sporulation protein A)